MHAYVHEWVSLLLRWTHVIVGIAWIGASFYFIWLDNHLKPPASDRGDDPRSVGGELWAIHGGGIYHAQKYRLAPQVLPVTLHWFKWEAYWTWITGFALLVVLYYANAEVYLIDPAVRALSPGQAVGIGLAAIFGGLVVYEGLCRSPLGRNDRALALVLAVLLVGAAWGLTQVFSGRGAFIHFGAILGTLMAGNVANVIIPGQRALVRAVTEGRAPDPAYAARAKQRSVHNTYFTLPAVFTMISGHYATVYGHAQAWVALVLIAAAGALIRVWFVQRHKQQAHAAVLIAGIVALAASAALVAPRSAPPGTRSTNPPAAKFGDVRAVIAQRCVSCHAEKPTQTGFTAAPKGVLLDSAELIGRHAVQSHQQSVLTRVMPPGNLTGMTDEERRLLDAWFRSGAKID
ncbi:MAG: urate hydroxylase PuuD [Betaproteobacteria bacterium]|nr:urate hydroxylase PuuD [Betaproteobacteria bacterium]